MVRVKSIRFLVLILASLLIATGFWNQGLAQEVSPRESGGLAGPTETLSLSEILRIALEHNAGLAVSRREVAGAGKGLEIARGKRLGRVDLVANYLYSGFGEAQKFRVGALAGAMPLLSPRLAPEDQFAHNTFALGEIYRIPLYTGGQLTADIRLNEISKVLAENRLRQTQDELIFNVTSAYYTILKLKKVIEADEVSVGRLVESKRVVESFVDAGRAPRVDLLKIDTRLAAVRQSLIAARNALETTLGVLNTLMGREATAPKVIVGEELRYVHQAMDLGRSIQEALERKPEYQAARKEVDLQEQKVRMAFSERLPNVSLTLGLQSFTGDQNLGAIVYDATAGVALTLPLFDGAVIRSRVTREQVRLEQAKEALEQTRLDLILGVQTAFLNVKEAESRIEVAEAALNEAKEALRIEQMKIEAGRGIIENLLDAQTAQLQGEQGHVVALTDYEIEMAALQKAVGAIPVP